MCSLIRSVPPLVALCLLTLTGCQKKFEYEKAFTLTPGEVQASMIDAPSREQRVTITVTAADTPINVLVVPESAHAETMTALNNLKKVDAGKVIASKDKVENETLEATIPAKTGFSVFFSGAKKQTAVKVKIVGK